MTYAFLADLCESHLIPSKTSLNHWDAKVLAELSYLYFIGLRILLSDDDTKQWAREYCRHAGEPSDFATWRTNANDLYAMLYALTAEPDDATSNKGDRLSITPSVIRHWLRHIATHDDEEDTHRLFMRLDGMFRITNSALRSLRRIVTDWDDADARERKDVLTKVVQLIHTRAPSNSELLPHLKSLASHGMKEAASGGATGAASVATAVGGLGAGFDPNGDRGIYANKKPAVIRRNANPPSQ